MYRRYLIGVLVVGLLAVGGWTFAQQQRPRAKAPAPEGGQFVVSPAGDTAVLLETKSGKTWVLHRSVEGRSVWLPAKRIDTEEDVLRWRQEEEIKQKLAVGAKGAQELKKFSHVDLQPKANAKLTGSFGSGFLDLGKLPQGEQTFQDVKFKITEDLIQLGREKPPLKEPRPDKVEGIQINNAFAKLHLLHATVGGAFEPDQFIADDTPIAEYKVHYGDGAIETIPVVYGKDLRDFYNHDDFREVKRAKLAWTHDRLRLYQSTWENPHPAKMIVRIDFVKVGDGPVAPFCVAMTLEHR